MKTLYMYSYSTAQRLDAATYFSKQACAAPESMAAAAFCAASLKSAA